MGDTILFYADAGGNLEVNYNETILLSAADIGEDAVYNWYDSDGNKVHQGKNFNVTIYDETEFRLEVTALPTVTKIMTMLRFL